MSERIGFLGLGNMGLPMALRLIEAGFDVTVYNRTAEKTKPATEKGAKRASSPADAVAADGIAVTMVADDAALERLTLGDGGLAAKLGKGGVHLSMSTIDPETSRRLAEAHGRYGTAYVAAPVFGRPEAAAGGKLWPAVAGPAAAKQRVKPLLEAMGQGSFDFGEAPEAANVVKLAGNFLIAAAIEAMAEAFTLAEKHGIERTKVAEMFGATVFDCPIYRNYGKAVAEERYRPAGFRLKLGLKDVRLVLDAAETARVPMPVANLLHDRLVTGLARRRDDYDWTGLALGASEDAGTR